MTPHDCFDRNARRLTRAERSPTWVFGVHCCLCALIALLAFAACQDDSPASSTDTDTDTSAEMDLDSAIDSATDSAIDAGADQPDDIAGADAPTADVALDPTDGDAMSAPDTDMDSGGLLGDGLWPPPHVLSNALTLDVELVREWQGFALLQIVNLSELRYTSWEVIDGVVQEVSIEAFVAIPNGIAGGAPDPAVVIAHGLGGNASPDPAATLAAHLGVVTIYYSGPGNGESTGRGSGAAGALFDTIPDPRGSWFWGHAVAGSRAVTVLTTLPDVDPDRIGMTGYSAGAMATLNVNGFDDRLRAAVPVSGCGDLGTATAAGGWENALLEADGLTPESDEFVLWLQTVDPINLAPEQHGPVLLINGAQDEFFPIDSTVSTYLAFPGDAHRLQIIADWDHGWFANDVPLHHNYDNSEAAVRRMEAGQAFWFGHYLTGNARFAELPDVPSSALVEAAGVLVSVAVLDTDYDVEVARTYASGDGSYVYGSVELAHTGGSTWQGVTLLPADTWGDHNLVYFTELRLGTGILGPEIFVTSVPHIPPGFVPTIRPLM